ncbi:MAG TPA: CsgG/HfaB family protein [Terriglobales bacterium]|nr:CsgG/HfaB family protein [Terriglobales bacterium]
MGRCVKTVLVLMALVAVCAAQNNAPPKKRVAVMDFDYATVQSGVAAIFGTNVDVGKGIADILVNNLVKSGTYSVIERKALDKILAEQNFSNSDRADPSSAAKLARILGVDAMIIGSITQFGRDDKNTNVGGAGFGRVFGLGGVSKKEAKAVVGINARVISTETAEILAVAEGKGESTRGGTSLIGAGGGWGGAGAGAFDMSSSNFANTILGEAVHKAVDSVSHQLDQEADKLPTHVVKVEGLVADATGGTLILNVGSRAGVKVGDQLEVRRVTREVKDPSTGKVLRRIADKVGMVTVTEVDESSAVGTYTGSGPAQVGDSVQTP